jgi:fumarate hydratase class II
LPHLSPLFVETADLKVSASDLKAIASELKAMASDLKAIAFDLKALASDPFCPPNEAAGIPLRATGYTIYTLLTGKAGKTTLYMGGKGTDKQ